MASPAHRNPLIPATACLRLGHPGTLLSPQTPAFGGQAPYPSPAQLPVQTCIPCPRPFPGADIITQIVSGPLPPPLENVIKGLVPSFQKGNSLGGSAFAMPPPTGSSSVRR